MAEGRLKITYRESGWATESISLDFLSFLKFESANESNFALLWDVSAANRAEPVKQVAADNGIGLLFIPSGQTGEWQPLDYRIFGGLKARAPAELDRQNVVAEEDNEKHINWELAGTIFVQCREAIPESEVINSWAKLDDTIKTFNDSEAEEEYQPENATQFCKIKSSQLFF